LPFLKDKADKEFELVKQRESMSGEIDKILATKGVENLEKRQEKLVPDLGQYATSPAEAEKIKASLADAKSALFNLNNIINLRKDKGVEFLEREDVNVGKNAAADLKLQLKTMYSLGVLSKSDLDMLDKLVPNDPTQMDWSPFGDPVMAKMEAFRTNLLEKVKNNLTSRGMDPTAILQTLNPQAAGPRATLDDAGKARLEALRAKKGL